MYVYVSTRHMGFELSGQKSENEHGWFTTCSEKGMDFRDNV